MLKVLFAGSPAIAVPSLRMLGRLEREGLLRLAGVLTNPDSPRGRSGRPLPTEVASAAGSLPAARILKPERLDGAAREAAAALGADLLVSFAYGRIFGPRFLGSFPLGGVNVHPSLLPRHRGAAPIQAAILGGDAGTGITVQTLAEEMDAGDVLAQERVPLSGRETAESLGGIMAERGAALLASVLGRFASGERPLGRPQEGEPSYCRPFAREDGRIDWNLGAGEIDRRIRAFTPWPPCSTWRGGGELFILAGHPLEGSPSGEFAPPGTVLGVDRDHGILIQTGGGVFAAERLQYRARKALDWKSFLNGAPGFVGSRLGRDAGGDGGTHGVQA